MASRPELTLSLQFADASHRAQLPRHKVARWIRAALAAPAEITVRVVDGEEGQALNRDFRGKDYATNVLTFDYSREPVVSADLVLCAPVVAREAAEQAKSIEAHYAHLLVHGTLHAQGFDHFFVRPAWAHSCGCKSRRKLITANEVKRNCERATDRGEEAWIEAASRWTRTG
jgi:probable rRNA maturation factor